MSERFDYIGQVEKIRSIIDELELAGLDMKSKREELESVNNKTIKIEDREIELSLDEKILSLNYLLKSLITYSEVINISRKVSYLENSFINYNARKQETINLINLVRYYRSKLESTPKLVNRAYTLYYNMIKEEFLYELKSDILDIVLEDKTDTMFIDTLIRKDINDIKSSTYTNELAYNTLLSIEAKANLKGLSANMVSSDVILSILFCTKGDENFKRNVIKKLYDIKSTLEENKAYFISNEVNKSSVLDCMRIEIEELKNYTKKYKEKLIALILSSVIFTGALGFGSVISKNIGEKNYFKTDKETTIYVDGEYKKFNDQYYSEKVNNEGRETKLYVYDALSTYRFNYYRNYDVYDLSKAVRDTLEELVNIDLDSPGVEMIESDKAIDYNTLEEVEYTSEYRSLDVITQDFTDSYTEYNYKNIIGFLIILWLSGVGISLTPIGPEHNFEKLREFKKKKQEEESEFLNNNEKIKLFLEEAFSKINSSKELKEKFDLIISSGIVDVDNFDLKSDIVEINRLFSSILESNKECDQLKEEVSKLVKKYYRRD